jgi:putative hydrolase of the HAD superfamily
LHNHSMRIAGRRGETTINAVILDYGEVLCHRPSPAEFHRLANAFGADGSSFPALWEKNRGAFDRGDMTAEVYWGSLAEDAGTTLTAEQLEEVSKWDIEMWGNANAHMVAWLRGLREAGIKTALLSNIHPAMIAYVRENFEWLELFDFKTFSAEVHLIKPEPAIYEHTLRGLAAAPHETLFVDDRDINVEAARGLGIHALRFRSVEQLRQDLEAMGFPILPSAEE